MKKIFSLLLVGVMVFSMIPAAYATTDVSNGTAVEYDASQDTTIGDSNQDGQPDNQEYYTVTVPAVMAPGDTGYVVAKGTWASNRKLVVGLKENTVTLVNSISAADTKKLSLTFDGIILVGSNTAPVSNVDATTAPNGTAITVANIENALFGTWECVFEYTVAMQNVA